jgi:2-dehydropantoate 2-reductase
MLDMTLSMAPYRASMKIDLDEHKSMKVEAIYGNPVRTAGNVGATMPLVETLYCQLKFLDARNFGLARPCYH